MPQHDLDTPPQAVPAESAIGEFAQRVMGDAASALTVLLAALGDRHRLFRALAVEPATATQLAQRTGLSQRYLHEWLAAMAARRYVDYDTATRAFSLPAAQVPRSLSTALRSRSAASCSGCSASPLPLRR